MRGGMRNPMPELPAEVRNTNFEEVALGFDEKTAVDEAQRCLHCNNPMCVTGCPISTSIPDFIHEVAEGNFAAAYKILKTKNSLTAVCGRVCPQERQCEGKCILGIKGQPVAIGALERFVADYGQKHDLDKEIIQAAPDTGNRVAVVGSGPSSLVVAGELARMGHKVTVLEALHKLGGVLSYGIPEFRLPRNILENEISNLKRLGVEFQCNAVVGKTYTIDDLKGPEGFDAVYLGLGADTPRFMNIKGENLNGVYSANEFLFRVNLMQARKFPKFATPVYVGKKVAVVGGGNVAMDAARTAKRLGAENVYIIYRRTENEMPACKEEIEHAKAEGIEFRILTNPSRVLGYHNGWVMGLECMEMVLGEPDSSGRKTPIEKKNSEFVLPVDMVIMALGQGANPLIKKTTPNLRVNDNGNILTNDLGATNILGVFAGGDIVTGPSTVVNAVKAGKNAADAIDNYLKFHHKKAYFKLPVGISARHCHVTPEVLEALFGKGFKLTVKKMIKQPGQFASNQRVRFVTDKSEVNLSIVGPCRAYTQCELATTDCRNLGLPEVIRNSGDIKDSPGGKLIGPAGEWEMKEGAIVVARHVHLSEETAKKYRLKQGDRVRIEIGGKRPATLTNVLVRAGLEDMDEVHLDTDESNALFIKSDDIVTIITEDK